MSNRHKRSRVVYRAGGFIMATALLVGGAGAAFTTQPALAASNSGAIGKPSVGGSVQVGDWTWMTARGGKPAIVPGGEGWTLTRHQGYAPQATTLGELAKKKWKLDSDNDNVQFQILNGTPVLGLMKGYNLFPRDSVKEADKNTIWMGKDGYNGEGKTLSQWAEELGADTKVYIGLAGNSADRSTVIRSLSVGDSSYTFVQPEIPATSEDVYSFDWKWLGFEGYSRPGQPEEHFGKQGWDLRTHQGYSPTSFKLGDIANPLTDAPSRNSEDGLVLQILVGRILGNAMIGYNLFPAGNPAQTTADTLWVSTKDQREQTLADWAKELGADKEVYVGIAGLLENTSYRNATSVTFNRHTFNFIQRGAEFAPAKALSLSFVDGDIWAMPGKTQSDLVNVVFDKALSDREDYRWEIADANGKMVTSGKFDGLEGTTVDGGIQYQIPVDLAAGKYTATLYQGTSSTPILTTDFVNVEEIEHKDIWFDNDEITVEQGAKAAVVTTELFSHQLHDQPGYAWHLDRIAANARDTENRDTENRAADIIASGDFMGIEPVIGENGAELTLPVLELGEGVYEAVVTYEGQPVGTSKPLVIKSDSNGSGSTGGNNGGGTTGGNNGSGTTGGNGNGNSTGNGSSTTAPSTSGSKKPSGLATTGAAIGGLGLLALIGGGVGTALVRRNKRENQ